MQRANDMYLWRSTTAARFMNMGVYAAGGWAAASRIPLWMRDLIVAEDANDRDQ